MLNTIKTGNYKGKPLVLLHGWGADSSFLLPIAKMFEDRDIIAIDMPGYGINIEFSSLAPNFDATCSALLNTIPRHSDVLAWSLSSLYAIRTSSIDTEHKIDSITTLCGTPRFPSDPNWPGMPSNLVIKCHRLLTPKRCHRILKYFAKLQSIEVDKIYPDSILLQQFIERMPDTSYDVLKAGIDAMCFGDEREDFKYLKIPTLNLFGAKDRLVPAKVHTYLCKNNGTKSFIFKNSAHLPHITEPHLFEHTLRDFYKTIY